MRSAAGANANSARSKSHSLPSVEIVDNIVDHRNRGRGTRQLEKQSPADDYMNTVTQTVAHPDRSGSEGTPTEEPDAINPLTDQLPLSNFMTEVEPVDGFLHTRVGPRDHEVKSITMKVCGTFEKVLKSGQLRFCLL